MCENLIQEKYEQNFKNQEARLNVCLFFKAAVFALIYIYLPSRINKASLIDCEDEFRLFGFKYHATGRLTVIVCLTSAKTSFKEGRKVVYK